LLILCVGSWVRIRFELGTGDALAALLETGAATADPQATPICRRSFLMWVWEGFVEILGKARWR